MGCRHLLAARAVARKLTLAMAASSTVSPPPSQTMPVNTHASLGNLLLKIRSFLRFHMKAFEAVRHGHSTFVRLQAARQPAFVPQ